MTQYIFTKALTGDLDKGAVYGAVVWSQEAWKSAEMAKQGSYITIRMTNQENRDGGMGYISIYFRGEEIYYRSYDVVREDGYMLPENLTNEDLLIVREKLRCILPKFKW